MTRTTDDRRASTIRLSPRGWRRVEAARRRLGEKSRGKAIERLVDEAHEAAEEADDE